MSAATAALATAKGDCRHCGLPSGGAEFCCAGCRLVFGLLHSEGLERYYDLRGGPGVPVSDLRADRKWVEPLVAELAGTDGLRRIALDVQGIHCAACVWLIEELFRRSGGADVVINPALGNLEIAVDRGFGLDAFVASVESCGYRLGPALKDGAPRAERDGILLRLGVCAALSMNAMIFAFATYAGLSEGFVYRLFVDLQVGLAALAVAVGGSLFIRSAWRSLRLGLLHLDLPIALGILLAFGSSAVDWATQRAGAAYFDTLTVFITLMLLGRFLQERVLERNRRDLLADDGAENLLARRVSGGKAELCVASSIGAGDRLLLAAGDLLVVEAVLDEERASLSLDWVSGESTPRVFVRGERIPAGAFNVGPGAASAIAAADFASSSIIPLLRTTRGALRAADAPRATPWWQRLSGGYVIAVLVAAAGALVFSLAIGRDAGRALDVTAAVLILTCPCAFGIATPLAYELVQGGLRRQGLFIRSASFLDRAAAVRRVVFDKTGTLTTGKLNLADPAPLADLTAVEKTALYDLAARSSHPKSAAVARALEGSVVLTPAALIVEVPGVGPALVRDGHRYALGVGSGAADLLFSVDGAPRLHLTTRETLRVDAAAEIARLGAAGLEVWILSGDAPDRVRDLAVRAGVPQDRALGGMSPAAKAAWLDEHDRGDTLFCGDGLNDAPAADRATCSGTPAVDRPFMPARSDFYYVTPGVATVGVALAAARKLGRVTRRNLAVAVAYNVAAVAIAYAGLMSPLLCAVLMPASSLSIVALTVVSLSRRSSLWTS